MENSPIKPYTKNRPWGSFTEFTENLPSTVKIIKVQPDQELSLQYHHNREEFWFIISGSGTATIGDKEISVKENDICYAPKETNHRIKANDEVLTFLEISIGNFDEEDIVRVSDDYGRIDSNN